LEKFFSGTETFLYDHIVNTQNIPTNELEQHPRYGNGENVIFIRTSKENDNPDWVIKINKVVLGSSVSELHNAAQIANREYKLVKRWFQDTNLTIPDEHTIVGHSHLRFPSDLIRKQKSNIPTLITLQKFVPGTFEGIFENHKTVDSLETRLRGTGLTRAWGEVASRIVTVFDHDGVTPDILGLNNFSLNDRGVGEQQLVHIDPHMIQTPDLVKSWNLEDEHQRRLDFIRESARRFT
jgi:hypothetical protein